MAATLNEKPFSHSCRHGTAFESERCDFKTGVKVVKPENITEVNLGADFAEFGSFHAMHILERLNGFQGYDCIEFAITEGD